MFLKKIFFSFILLFFYGCSIKEKETNSIIYIPTKIILDTPKNVENFVEKKIIPVVSNEELKEQNYIANNYKVSISSSVYAKQDIAFDLDSFSTMKIKNWLIGVNENEQQALVGYVYENFVFKYSTHDDLFGIKNLELNERTHYFSVVKEKQILNGTFGTALDLGIGTTSKSNLYGYGYKSYYETYGFGLMYQENISIKSGEIAINNETYSFINSSSFDPQKDLVFYKNFYEKNIFINVGVKENLNKEISNNSQMFFNLFYPF